MNNTDTKIKQLTLRVLELYALQEQKMIFNPDLGISKEAFDKIVESERKKNSSELTTALMDINLLIGERHQELS
jgi:hypothetical protein